MKYGLHIRDPCPPSGSGGEVCDEQRKRPRRYPCRTPSTMPPTVTKRSNPAFESSYACTLETAFADMRQTKEQWHKPGGVQGYHLVQSFCRRRGRPELAHQIAKELADRVLGGRYEYVIGTHLNTGHIHSHIVWNSVSCVDGKKVSQQL